MDFAVLKKYQKAFYIFSLIFLALVGVNSLEKNIFLIIYALVIILTPVNFRSLKEIPAANYALSGIIVYLLVAVVHASHDYSALLNVVLASYSIVHSVDLCSRYILKLTTKTKELIPDKTTPVSLLETIVIAISSIVTLTFFTTSSPLYVMNLWNDTNCFFTMGRGMKHGLVMYRDIFDHKGPYVYFLNYLAALISDQSFVGLYIIEIICCFVFTFFSWKIIHLFYSPKKYSLVLIPLTTIMVYSSYPFSFGGSTEELCFPFLTVILYLALKSEVQNRTPNRIETILIGLFTGYAFFTKFTFVGLVIGYIFYIVYRLVSKKESKLLPVKIVEFLIGYFIAALPIILYFGINNAFDDFFSVYFYDNIFLYTGVERISYYDIVFVMGKTLGFSKHLFYGLILSILLMSGLNKNHKTMYLSMLIVACITTFMTKIHLFYYCLILTALIAPGLALISLMFDKLCERLSKIKFHPEAFVCLLVIMICGYIFSKDDNLNYMNMEKSEFPQFAFVETINQTPDAKVLTYDFIDAGFYTCAGIYPPTRYYCVSNLTNEVPGAIEEREAAIIEGQFDYIITTSDEVNWDNYVQVQQFAADNETFHFAFSKTDTAIFYLYQRADLV